MKVPGTKYDPERDMTRDSKYRTPFGDLKVFFGSSAQHLKASICSHAGVPAGKYERRTFSNENIFIRLNESVRGQDVYIVQSMSSPVHDNFMELLIMIDAVMRDSAGRVNVVIPYLTYGRSDKKDQPRVPITARLVANMIETAGADRYITVDLHAGQIQGFFNIPGDAIRAFYLLSDYVRDKRIPDLTIVSADLATPSRHGTGAKRLRRQSRWWRSGAWITPNARKSCRSSARSRGVTCCWSMMRSTPEGASSTR